MPEIIIDKIENSCGEGLSVRKILPPPYLSIFTQNSSEEIIFVSEKNEVFKKKADFKLVSDDVTCAEVNDVTGNPLESPFTESELANISLLGDMEDEDKDIEFPLCVQDARQILGKCNLMRLNIPVWVLCDSLDKQKYVLMGCNIGGSWAERSWVVDTGTQTHETTLEDKWKEHLNISQLPGSLIKYKFKQISNPVNSMDHKDSKLLYSSTFVEIHWAKKSVQPCLGSESKAYFTTKCFVGRGTGGGLSYMWSQLLLLQEYLNCVKKKQEDRTPFFGMELPSSKSVLEYLYKGEAPEEPMNIRLKSLLENPIPRKLAHSKEVSFIQLVDSVLSPGGDHLDFMDHLWNILIESTTYKDLARNFIFNDKNKLSSYISNNNYSKLATILKRKDNVNMLDPLESLIEIGLEKLRKEVDLIFTRAQIVQKTALNCPPLPKFMETTDWLETVETWMLWLSRIYCALELLYNSEQQLQLESSLASVAPAILQKYVGHKSLVKGVSWLLDNPEIEIKAAIPSSAQESALTWSMNCWILNLTSETETRRLNSVFFAGTEKPFPKTVSSTDFESSVGLFTATYHCIADNVDLDFGRKK